MALMFSDPVRRIRMGQAVPPPPFHQQYSPIRQFASPVRHAPFVQVPSELSHSYVSPQDLEYLNSAFPPSQFHPCEQSFYRAHNHLQVESSHDSSLVNPFEFIPQTSTSNLPSASHTPQPQANPYVQETNSMTYYQGSNSFSQPVRLVINTISKAVADFPASFNTISMLLWAHIGSIYDRVKEQQETSSFPRTYARCCKDERTLHYQYFKVCLMNKRRTGISNRVRFYPASQHCALPFFSAIGAQHP